MAVYSCIYYRKADRYLHSSAIMICESLEYNKMDGGGGWEGRRKEERKGGGGTGHHQFVGQSYAIESLTVCKL